MALLEGLDPTPGNDKFGDLYAKFDALKDALNLITAGNILAVKTLQIGDWNMVASANVNVAHGLSDAKKIRSARAVIFGDAGATHAILPLESVNDSGGIAFGGIKDINSTYIVLTRNQDAFFNSTEYDSTSYNRGYVTITYEK